MLGNSRKVESSGMKRQSRLCIAPKPEFDGWRWVSYWYPLGQVVAFKRDVYRRAMKELAPRLPLELVQF